MTKKKVQVPIKDMLNALDRGNTKFYENLDKDQKKAFSPWLAMRWASNVRNKDLAPHYLSFVNDLCNKDFAILSKHPELFWKLLTVAGLGQSQNHGWIPPAKKQKKNKVQQFLSEVYPLYSLEDLKMLEHINSEDDIRKLAREYGWEKADIDGLFK